MSSIGLLMINVWFTIEPEFDILPFLERFSPLCDSSHLFLAPQLDNANNHRTINSNGGGALLYHLCCVMHMAIPSQIDLLLNSQLAPPT